MEYFWEHFQIIQKPSLLLSINEIWIAKHASGQFLYDQSNLYDLCLN